MDQASAVAAAAAMEETGAQVKVDVNKVAVEVNVPSRNGKSESSETSEVGKNEDIKCKAKLKFIPTLFCNTACHKPVLDELDLQLGFLHCTLSL